VTIGQADDAEGATLLLQKHVRARDVVLVKASNSIGLARLVEAMAGEADPKCFI
jgi:UDP-N-acetylmuramyl pentapeptide synthase